MFCRKCGQEIREGAKFCTKCGTAVPTPKPVQQQPVQPRPVQQQPVQPKPVQPKPVQQQPVQQPPKKKKGAGPIIALVVCAIVLLLLIGGLLVAIKIKMDGEDANNSVSRDRDNRIEEMESTEDDRKSTETEESVGTEETTQEETEVMGGQPGMTLEQYGESLSKCQLEGVQYTYTNEEGLYYTEGLKGVNGCLTYTIVDLDADGQDELLAFQIDENVENGNNIYAQVYENTDSGIELADETLLLEGILGSMSDSGAIRMMLKDKKYICMDYAISTYIAADGTWFGLRTYTYNGESLEEYLKYSIVGSSLEETGREQTDVLQKLRAMNMPKSAENLELRDNFMFSVADTGIESLAKIRVDNTYDYEVNPERKGEPVATCHLISGNASEEYILPQSSEKYLTEQDLSGLSAEQLRIARNEIYARYGWRFADEGLRKYFADKSWYMVRGYQDVTDDQLSDIEKANRDLIKSFESAQ